MSYNTVACRFRTGVICDCPTWSTSSLICVLCCSKGAFHYNARFGVMLISLGPQNERYNEVAVYMWLRLFIFLLTNKSGKSIHWNVCHDVSLSGSIVCRTDHFRCGPGQPCIPWSWRCDGHVDCTSGNDESSDTCKICHRSSVGQNTA